MKMICDYSDADLIDLIATQLKIFKITDLEINRIGHIFPEVKSRVEFSFSHSTNKYYRKKDEVFFNPFHSEQWCIFLYFLSNSLYKKTKSNMILCDKIYYLNRMLNSCDLFYEVMLPDIFFLGHPLGTVIGRGTFKNYFSFSQGCTIGNNKGVFPVIGERVKMLSNSKIIGDSNIGDNVIIAANTYIKDTNIPNNSIVFGSSPNLVLKENKLNLF
jgi:serine O-acetyltransferase